MQSFLAVDLGASSGRMLIGQWDGACMAVHELHRFDNALVEADGHLHWDAPRLWDEIRAGMSRWTSPLAGIGVDTWGLDYALLDGGGRRLGNPFAYRDPRTEGVPERVHRRVSREEMFAVTGLECMRVNTLYQLCAQPLPEAAETLLMMPDLFRWWLTGERGVEYTIATTTQMLDCRERTWASGLLERLSLPLGMLPPIVETGTIVGRHRDVPVVAVAGHDTASAVAAVPGLDVDSAFISSGTWSLMGVEAASPDLSSEALRFGMTNEGGVGGTIRLQKNIAGLWLLQESRRQWAREGRDHAWPELLALAADAAPLRTVIDPDAPAFAAPGDVPGAIRAWCLAAGEPPPQSVGDVVRCCMEGLALRYRWVLEVLERLTGRALTTVRVVGGGSQNALLCQLTADACGRPVVAGPVEATSLGNLMLQAIATGALPDLPSARAAVAASVEQRTYEPQSSGAWDDAFGRFNRLTSKY